MTINQKNNFKILLNDGRINIHPDYSDSEINSGEILTKPNLTMSVVELLDRYTHGRPLPDNMVRNNNYGRMTQLNKKGFDLADVPDLKRNLEKEIAENTARLKQLDKLKAEQAAEKRKKQLEELRKSLNNAEQQEKAKKEEEKENK